ncbi:Regulator of Ty1 transposition protein, putative [Candida maltosa Xu316]|uniref:Regulator of Ty1 transposition protein, putative n=1 Tax=Candida maltosa (strain Xu316) TaxID=1245528 RepID=M3HNZ7_CANMX|nr:Regulator of Ty1 transposition protein, putative [Candida maltosa Xu316]
MKKVLGQSSTSTSSKTTTTSSSSLSVSGDKIAPELKHVNELFIHLSKLTDISQGNLTQMGVQSKNYLNPQDSDNLPQPSVYISKLNLLEKLGKVCINNIDEIKKTRLLIKSQLDTLSNLIIDGTKTDDSKIGVINEKLSKLTEIRDELTDTTTTSTTNNSTFNVDDDNDDVNNDEDDMPAYDAASDSESDDDDDDNNTSRKRKMSQTPSGGSTPSKKVAFSEDIRVYDQPDDKQSSDDQQSQTNDNEEAEGEQQSDVFSLLSKLAD